MPTRYTIIKSTHFNDDDGMLLNADTFRKNKYMSLYINYELIYQFSGYATFIIIFLFFWRFRELE